VCRRHVACLPLTTRSTALSRCVCCVRVLSVCSLWSASQPSSRCRVRCCRPTNKLSTHACPRYVVSCLCVSRSWVGRLPCTHCRPRARGGPLSARASPPCVSSPPPLRNRFENSPSCCVVLCADPGPLPILQQPVAVRVMPEPAAIAAAAAAGAAVGPWMAMLNADSDLTCFSGACAGTQG
jgi:hypothetical protein